MNKMTKYEWQIISLFLFSLLFNVTYFHMKITTMIAFYIIGIIFEFLTEPLWDYNPELKKSPFTLKTKDINFLFGLGWLALIILSLSLGQYMERWITSSVVSGVLGVLIIGNILESIYYYFGLWKYNKSHPMLRFPPLIGKYIEVFKIPLSVRLGYMVNGIIAFYINVLMCKYF